MHNKGSTILRGRIWLATQALPTILRTRSPFLIALCLGLMMRPFGTGKGARVLTISKDMFEDDVRALAEFGENIAYRGLNLGTFKRLMGATVGDDITGIAPANYNLPGQWVEQKESYRNFLLKMLPIMKRLFRIDAVLACNYTYTALQEVSRTSGMIGLPYVVLYKEGLIVTGREQEWADNWRSHFVLSSLGLDRILTLAPAVRSVLGGEKIGSLENGQVRTTGFPRLDFYRQAAEQKQRARPLIVAFAFEPDTAFLYYNELRDGPERATRLAAMRERMTDQYRELFTLASAHPELDLIIKLKRGCPSDPFTRAAMETALGGPLETSTPANVSVTDGWVARDLIQSASVTVSLNSLTAVESVLAGVPVVTPDFDDFFPNGPATIFSSRHELTVMFRKAADLEPLLADPASFFQDKAAQRDAFLEEYANFADTGSSSRAVEKELLEAIAAQTVTSVRGSTPQHAQTKAQVSPSSAT